MKKYIALLLTLAIIASIFAGCVNKVKDDSDAVPTGSPAQEEITGPIDMEAFLKEIAKANPEGDLEKIFSDIVKNPYFRLFDKENTEWYFPGMNYDFKPEGVKDLLCITDNVSRKGSLVYVFVPEEGTDLKKLEESLLANADPKWMDWENGTDGTVSFVADGKLYFSMYDTNMKPITGKIAEKARDFVEIFHDYLAAHPEAKMTDLAEYFVTHQKFNGLASETVEPGHITGFGGFDKDVEITGFAEAAGFVPPMSPNLFIGYVFRLDPSADAEAFAKMLKDNANLAWNVCMTANTIITETDSNVVLFMMCNEETEK